MRCGIIVGLFLLAGCSGPALVPSSNHAALPAIKAPAAGVVGDYFSLADGDSDVKWADRLTAKTPLEKLTRLYINGGWIYQDKTGKFALALQYGYMASRMKALIAATRAKNPRAQMFIVSGYDADGDMYKKAARHPRYFADSVVAFIRAYKLDGYDCDWENGIVAGKMNALARAVHEALASAGKADGKSYLFTMAVWPSPAGRGYDLPALNKLVDQFGIMSYGEGDDLRSDAGEYASGGIAVAKLIGGIDTEIDYPTGVDTLGPKGTIAKKTAYARANALAGMMAWRLDNDYDVKAKPTYRGALQLWTSSGR